MHKSVFELPSNGSIRPKRNATTFEQKAKELEWIKDNKEEIEERFATAPHMTVKIFAEERRFPAPLMAKLLEMAGIRERQARSKIAPPQEGDDHRVLRHLCAKLGVDWEVARRHGLD